MLNATLTKRINLTSELTIFHVKPDAGVPEFSPGQYVALGLPGSAPRMAGAPPEDEKFSPDKLIKRAYSIGSSPHEREHLEFYIAIVPQGALTSRLALLKEGDRLFAAPKIIGTFTLHDVPKDHNLILVSTGTGIAPFMSMIREPETWEEEDRRIILAHGVRYPEDLAYAEELKELEEIEDRFAYLPIVSRADSSYRGERGRVQRLFEPGGLNLNPSTDHVFLCGNPQMIDDLEKILIARGYSVHHHKKPGTLHLERYW